MINDFCSKYSCKLASLLKISWVSWTRLGHLGICLCSLLCDGNKEEQFEQTIVDFERISTMVGLILNCNMDFDKSKNERNNSKTQRKDYTEKCFGNNKK